MSSLEAGTSLRQYQIERVIGQGGFGITYLAFDNDLKRQVAIKECFPRDFVSREGTTVVPTGAPNSKDFDWAMNKFVDEATTLARFKHPGIVQVLQILKEENKSAYIVLEFIEGQSLDEYIKSRPKLLSESELKSLITPIFDALEVVHKEGIAHRDIAPDNIYIRKTGKAVLLDFGAAKQMFGQHSRTMNLVVKDGYSAPEQYYAEGRQGSWTDVYAFAATLYRALSGKKPIDAMARLDAINNGEVDPLTPLSQLVGDSYSKEFIEAIELGLKPQVKQRPQSLSAWRNSLIGSPEQVSSHDGIAPLSQQKASNKSSIGSWLAASITGVAVLGLGGYIVFDQIQKQKETAALTEYLSKDTLLGFEEFRRQFPKSDRMSEVNNAIAALRAPWSRRIAADSRSVDGTAAATRDLLFVGANKDDMATILGLSFSGKTIWQVNFSKQQHVITDLITVGQNEILAVGYIRTQGTSYEKAFMAKITEAGEILWEKTFETKGNTRINAVDQLSTTEFVVIGSGSNVFAKKRDGWFARVSEDGKLINEIFMGGEGADEFTDIKLMQSGEFAVVGRKQRKGGDDGDFWLVKLTAAGALLLDRAPGGLEEDVFHSVASLRDGQILAVGHTESFGSDSIDGMIMRITRDNKTPPKILAERADDILKVVKVLDDDSVLVAGGTSSRGAGGIDGWIFKYSTDLKQVLWERVVGQSSNEIFNDIEVLNDGTILAVGSTENKAGDNRDLWVVRFGDNGEYSQ